jgi:hypothetical protein
MIVLTNAEKGNEQAATPETKKAERFKAKAAKEKFLKNLKNKKR